MVPSPVTVGPEGVAGVVGVVEEPPEELPPPGFVMVPVLLPGQLVISMPVLGRSWTEPWLVLPSAPGVTMPAAVASGVVSSGEKR